MIRATPPARPASSSRPLRPWRSRAAPRGTRGGRAKRTTASAGARQDSLEPPQRLGWNQSLLRTLLVRQLAVGAVSLLLSVPKLDQLLLSAQALDARSLGAGFGGGLILIAIGRLVEASTDKSAVAITQETEIFVLSLFGERRAPLAVGGVAAGLAFVTGVTEEILFRGVSFPNLVGALPAEWGGAGAPGLAFGALASSLLFGVAHWGGDRTREGVALVALETVYGCILAAVYVTSGYQLVSPILAHALYDFEAILFPHLRVTALMAYARDGAGGAGESPLVSRNALRIAAAAGQSADDVLRVRAAYLLVDRNRSGGIDADELRRLLAAFGIEPTKAQADAIVRKWAGGAKELSFDEFYSLCLDIGVARSPEGMIRTLLPVPGR